MLMLLVIALITVGYLWLKHRYSYWERHGVKGPRPIYIFGNLFESLTFQEHFSTAQSRWYNTYNDVPYVGFYKLLQPAVMIRDPELQREILCKSFMNFHENDAGISADDDLLKVNPFFHSGEEWRKCRALFGTTFSRSKIRPVFPSILQVGDEWKQYVRGLGLNTELDAKDICARFTTEAMLRGTFSINGKSFEKQTEFLDFGKSIFNPDAITAIRMMTCFIIPVIQKILSNSFLPPLISKRFTDFVRDQIKIRDSGSAQTEDIFQNILNSREKNEMTEVQIAGICFVLFFEAYETSSNALMFALYELVNNPHIQNELARRIEESIAANNNEITSELIQKHEYLEKVLFETMPIQPTLFGIQKKCTKAYTMPLLHGQKEAVTIPTGTPVLLPFATVLKDPTIFPDPNTFDPERFSPEETAMRPKSAFMPFSDGPRMCIGMHLGLFNLKMALFQTIQHFDVRFGPNMKPFELHPKSFFNIPKDGIKLIFTPRKTVLS